MAEEFRGTQVTRVIGRAEGAVRMMRRCTIEVLSGKRKGEQLALERPLFRIGSHASNDLVLPEETVSKHHLEVRAEPAGYRLVDLDSSNGTLLGKARIAELTVVEPVDLTVGGVKLQLRPESTEAQVVASQRTRFGRLQGRSPAMRELFAQLEAVAQSECAVLLEGETGVGKEVVGESLHEESRRREGPWVVVDCGGLSAGVLESELFGHEQGAFAGAAEERAGLLEAAHGGTLFLDEAAELPLELQRKLLAALERRRVFRLGAGVGREVDFRVVAATRRDLPREVNGGRFRADLFYALAVARIRVPPLRERLEDLPLLVEELLGELRERDGEAVPKELSAVTLARLATLPWPGNVRELRNTVEQALVEASARAPAVGETYALARERALEAFERGYFSDLLARHGGDLVAIAGAARIEPRELERTLQRLGLGELPGDRPRR